MNPRITRRSMLTATLGATLTGCGIAALVLAVHTDPDDPVSTAGNATLAEATAIAVRRLVGP